MRDPEKVKAARRRWYVRNSDSAKARVVERKRRLALQLTDYKNAAGCSVCGEHHPAVLDFHHIVPLRDSDPTTRVFAMVWRNGWGWDRIVGYVERECLVLCANCHRKHHWNERLGVPAS